MAQPARGVAAPALTESLERFALEMTRAARISAVSPVDPATGTIVMELPHDLQLCMFHGGAHAPEDESAISFRLCGGPVVRLCLSVTYAGQQAELAVIPQGLCDECRASLGPELAWGTIRDLIQTPGPEPLEQPPSPLPEPAVPLPFVPLPVRPTVAPRVPELRLLLRVGDPVSRPLLDWSRSVSGGSPFKLPVLTRMGRMQDSNQR
jgi:hypothetical protein